MFPAVTSPLFYLALRWGIFEKDRFLGKILDEWIADSQEFLHTKLPHLLVIAAIAYLLNKLLRLITLRMVHVAEQHATGPARIAEVKTLSGVIRTTGLAVIGLIAGLQFLDTLGFNLAPLLASAGVAGVAIGLAAQNIVKDMLNGILILIEGQFSVGDTVRLAGVAGIVEEMTLRKTTVRDTDGTLYVIPNSQITTVANLSVGFTMATVNVSVDFSANPDEVTKLLMEIALEVRNSNRFKNVILDDPQVPGVDAVKGSQMVFPVVFKTRATQQLGPIREFQRRVRLSLEEHHLLPGDPNRVFSTFASDEGEDRSGNKARGTRGKPEPDAGRGQDATTLKPNDGNPFSGE